jgi:hypothetical protein
MNECSVSTEGVDGLRTLAYRMKALGISRPET